MPVPESRPTLRSFDISQETGFIPERAPLSSLPPYFLEWEGLVARLCEELRSKRLRLAVHALPRLEFSDETLHGDREWQHGCFARANGYCAKTCALILKSASASCIRVYMSLCGCFGNEEVVMTGNRGVKIVSHCPKRAQAEVCTTRNCACSGICLATIQYSAAAR